MANGEKSRMKKRLLLLLLLPALLLSACAIENLGSIETNNQAGRVLVIMGEAGESQAAWDTVQALSAKYGRYLLYRTLDAATLADPARYATAVGQAIRDTGAQAVILAPAYAGAAQACGETAALTIALQPREAAALIAAEADLVVDADYAAIGEMAVEQALAYGATSLVYYEQGGFDYSSGLLARMEEAAGEQGLDLIRETLPEADLDAGLDGSLNRLMAKSRAEKATAPAAPAEADESCGPSWGAQGIPALFSDDPAAEEALLAAALRHGCICLPLPSLTPYGAFSRVFGIDQPADLHQGLSEYLRQVNLEIVANLRRPWNFAAWRRPLDSLELLAAAEYAFLWLKEGGSADFRQCLTNANAKAISTYNDGDGAYDNYWLHLISIREYGESGCG